MATPTPAETDAFVPFTKAERIQQLNDIDKSITTLLHSAGLALKTLTSQPQTTSSSTSPQKREIFIQTSDAYLKTLHSVDVLMRRQIYGLEEASIVPPILTKPKLSEQSAYKMGLGDPEPPPRTPEERRLREEKMKRLEMERIEENMNLNLKEGGMGKLDKGWLNTRSARVERDLEAELWRETRAFLESIGGLEGIEKGEREESNGKDHDMSG